jgi:choline-sulfatase
MRPASASALVALSCVLTTACGTRVPKTPPSLLLVTVDTLRADRVGAYGSSAGLTPAIDSLAASGWLFERAVAAVPLTLPSHATILSGLEPIHHGVRNNGTFVFPSTRETLATRLKAEGRATGAFVAAVVLDRRYGLARGFDTYDDRITRADEGRSVLESERPCDSVVQSASAWIQSQAGPFFAWVHLYEPHAPYAASAEMAARHKDRPYDAEVAASDACVAKLLAVARAARPDSLVTAVTSDHGEGLSDHGESTHGLFVYQSTLEVPMVIAGAGVPAGKRTAELARSADLAPTLLALLGVGALQGIDGHDLSNARGAGESYAETDYPKGFGWSPLRSFRLGDLKLIDAPEPELFDLGKDPREERNLAGEQPAQVERLRGVLRSALATEVRVDERRMNAETEERLRSLGYVSGGGAEVARPGGSLDPKRALPLFRDFERAMESEARGDRRESARLLRGLIRLDPSNLTFHRSLAASLRRDSRVEESVSVLRSAEKLAPRDATIAHDLALSLAESGNPIQAIESEERALAIDPGFVDSLEHLASLRALRGEFDQARSAVDRAITLDPNNARAFANRGNIARGQGRIDEAEKSYARAVELAPGLVDALNGLGVLAVEKGRLDEAAERFERVLTLDTDFHEARLNLAVVEAQRGRPDRARALAREAAKLTRDPGLKERSNAFLRDLGPGSR